MYWHLMPRDTRASSLVVESITCHNLICLSGNSALVCLVVVSLLVSKLLVPFSCSFIF